MKEFYKMIEKKIRESGYPRPIVGSDVYDDICGQCLKITHGRVTEPAYRKTSPIGRTPYRALVPITRYAAKLERSAKKRDPHIG